MGDNPGNVPVTEPFVELLRCRVGYPHFKLDGCSKFNGKLVFNPAYKQPADPTVPVYRGHANVADMTVDILPVILNRSHNKTCHQPIADRDKIGCRIIGERF
jgi:hypothetical protein